MTQAKKVLQEESKKGDIITDKDVKKANVQVDQIMIQHNLSESFYQHGIKDGYLDNLEVSWF